MRLLIAEAVIAERVARQIGLIHDPLNLFCQTALTFEFGIVSLNVIGDEGVIDCNEIAAGTVKRIGKAPSLSDQRPALRADGLPAIV